MRIAVRSWEYWTAAALAVTLGCVSVLPINVKPTYQAAFYLALTGIIVLATVPNQRITLVLVWILFYPLSIEKIFQFGTPQHLYFPLPSVIISAADVAFYLLLGKVLLDWFLAKRPPIGWPAAATPYLVLCVWVSLMFLKAPSVAGMLQVMHWWKMLAFLLVLPAAIRSRGELYLVLFVLAVSIGLQSLIVWLSWRIHKPISFITLFSPSALPLLGFGGSEGTVLLRASGTFGQVNQQAGLHVFFTLPLIGLAFVRNLRWRIFGFVIAGLSLSAILLTFSRTAWLAISIAGFAIILLAVVYRRMTRRTWAVFGLAAGLACLVVAAFINSISTRLLHGDEGATSSRFRMIVTSLNLTLTHPLLGSGPGNFVEDSLGGRELNRRSSTWNLPGANRADDEIEGLESYRGEINGKRIIVPLQVHNKYLLVLSELGLVGLSLFVWYQWRLLRMSLESLRTDDATLFWTAAGLFGALVASQVYYMLELAYDDKSVLVLMLPSALLLCVHQIVKGERRHLFGS